MADPLEADGIRAAVSRLRQLGAVPAVAAGLRSQAAACAEMLADAVVREVTAYTESGNPDVLPALKAHLGDLVSEACELLGGGRPGTFPFIARYAEQSAQLKFPLDAILQAYRVVHKALSPWIRDAAIVAAADDAQLRRVVAAVADFTIEFTGTAGSLVTARYVQHTRVIAEAEGDRRGALLSTLLEGYDESDSQAATLLRRAGYLEQRQAYCVIMARSPNAAEMENPARAQRMADSITACLAGTRLRHIVGVRDNHVVAVVSVTRRLSGWTAPRSGLAQQVYDPLLTIGPAALIGLSNDVPSTSHVPRAANEARYALDRATVADRVVPYARISFCELVVSHAQQAVRSALPAWTDGFIEADRRARGRLSATLRAYADADMNVLQAAKDLGVHPNTIYARMQKIEALTGQAPLRYHALTEMLLALDCAGAW